MSTTDARLRFAAIVAVAVLIADQLTKAAVERTMALHDTIPLAPFLALTYVRNTGAAFGLLAAAPASVRLPLFFAVTALAAGALVGYLRRTPSDRRWLVAGLGGILGGAIGNLVCRARYGAVTDFLDVHWGDLHWPAFNLADAAITLGVALVLLHARHEASAERQPSVSPGR